MQSTHVTATSFRNALYAFAIGIWAVGCRTPTQVTVEISTDLPCSELPDTTVQVGRIGPDLEGRPISVATRSCDTNGRIGSIVVAPSGEPSDEFGIKVVLGHGGKTAVGCSAADATSGKLPGCIVARRGLHYVPSTQLTLPIVLRADCDGKVCPDPATTCLHGSCVRARIDTCPGGRCDEGSLGTPDGGDVVPDSGTPDVGDAPDIPHDGDAHEAASDADGDSPDVGAPSPTPPSCATPLTCGMAGDSCCESLLVAGDTFLRMNDPDYPANVSTFRLDKYETTVGRFRAFVAASTSWRPTSGSGKHSHLPGGGLYDLATLAVERGWNADWNANLPQAKTVWDNTLDCVLSSWTPDPGGNEHRPIVCVSWFEAYAFCIWDGGFLPSYAEWQYAFVGGREQRAYPWGDTAPDTSRAQYCVTGCSSLINVGFKVPGNGRYGQSDLAGNAFEWLLDMQVTGDTCTDCVLLDLLGKQSMTVGGGWDTDAASLKPTFISYDGTDHRDRTDGFRCARPP